MSRFNKMDILSFGLPLAGGALSLAVYPELPARIATHFDLHGDPNGWMDRPYGAFVIPVVALLGSLFAPRSVPSSVRLTVSALLTALHVLLLQANLHPDRSMARLPIVLGIGWIALGQVLPRVRRNRFVGIRTPWTLGSEEVWLRTHRVASYTFAAGGAVSLLCALLPRAEALPAMFAAILTSALAPAFYSFGIARSLSKEA